MSGIINFQYCDGLFETQDTQEMFEPIFPMAPFTCRHHKFRYTEMNRSLIPLRHWRCPRRSRVRRSAGPRHPPIGKFYNGHGLDLEIIPDVELAIFACASDFYHIISDQKQYKNEALPKLVHLTKEEFGQKKKYPIFS
jgi:hypothetical protein